MSFKPEKPCRPVWMSRADWDKMCAAYRDSPRCAITGAPWSNSRLTVSHKTLGQFGGWEQVDDLRFVSASLLGGRSEEYWSQQRFYWDLVPDWSQFRESQRRVLSLVKDCYGDYFSRPWPEITGLLYLMACVVGSGKTLMTAAFAFAMNHLLRSRLGNNCPRINRYLVLVKEQSIRDQIYNELRHELVDHGIMSVAPKVGVIREGKVLGSAALDGYDVVVACVQQVWSDRSGNYLDRVGETFRRFPLAFLDESHFAADQAVRLARQMIGTTLLVPMTSSPITATGKSLQSCRRLYVYDMHDANRYDQSLKYIDTAPNVLDEIIEEVDIVEAEIRQGTQTRTVSDTNDPAYSHSLAAAKTVLERVVAYVKECDEICDQDWFGMKMAPHRPDNAVMDFRYPMHAMVTADSIDMGRRITAQLNQLFDSDRVLYPRDKGFSADLVCSGGGPSGEPESKSSVKAEPLDPMTHAWFACKRKEDLAQATRFLVVVNMGREGINNPYCGVIGVTSRCESVIEAVQRWVGRLLRSASRLDKATGVLHVPCRRLDTPRIITHSAARCRSIIEQGIAFVCNMRDRLDDIPSIDASDAVSASDAETKARTLAINLSDHERASIVVTNHRERNRRETPGACDVLIDSIGAGSPQRLAAAREWLKTVREKPAIARERFGSEQPPRSAIPAVIRETSRHAPTVEDLKGYLRRKAPKSPDIAMKLDEGDESVRWLLEQLYAGDRNQHTCSGFPTLGKDLENIRAAIAKSVQETLRPYYTRPAGECYGAIREAVGSAVKILLGVPKGISASIGSAWDCPQFHAILAHPDTSTQIKRFAQYRVLTRGYCREFAEALGVPQEDGRDQDDGNEAASS